MKRNYLRLPPLLIASLAAAAVAALLQTVAALTVFEKESFYFSASSALPTAAALLALLSALLGTLSAFCNGKKEVPAHSVLSCGNFYFNAAPALLLCGAVLLSIPTFHQARLAVPAALMLLPAALYTVLIGLPKQRQSKTAVALLGFCAVIACVLLNAYLYFDMSVPMNAPMKTALQTALLCAMLLIVGELRYLLEMPQPRVFQMLAAWTVAASSLVFPALPLAFLLQGYTRADHCAIAVLIAFFAVNAATELFRLYPPQNKDLQTELDERTDDSSERTPQ